MLFLYHLLRAMINILISFDNTLYTFTVLTQAMSALGSLDMTYIIGMLIILPLHKYCTSPLADIMLFWTL